MDRTVRTHYIDPTTAQVRDEIVDLMSRLGMYRDNDAERRDALTELIVDELPYRLVRLVERRWEAQA